MSLLDGRYEVMAQRPLGGGRSQFDATAPDGTPLRIEWFELPAGHEAEFERYRRLLKRLKQGELAAVHDVVSRPGAHYVAWLRPSPDAPSGRNPQLEATLAEHGYSPASADVRRSSVRPARTLLYALNFGSADEQAVARSQAAITDPNFGSHQVPGADALSGTHQRGGARLLRRPEDGRLVSLRRLPQAAISWGASSVLLLLATVLLVVNFQLNWVDKLVRVPDLVGGQAQPAADTLTDLRLTVRSVALASDEPPGTVLAVEPPAGTELRPGRIVQLSYALPRGQLAPSEVPNLVGLAYPVEADAAVQRVDLRLGDVARIHSGAPPGTVLAQGVDAGNRLGSGEGVPLLVSMGPRPAQTFVPPLVGLDRAEALSLARLAGISDDRVHFDEVAASSGRPGQVLSQSLAPYVPVALDEAVLRLVVQVGSGTSTAMVAPDLVGMSLAQARTSAPNWDLRVANLANSGLPKGIVAQDPAPGATADGRVMTLTINAHPVKLTTAGVRGVVRQPELRRLEYAWTIQPGIRPQQAEVWATDMEGERTLVAREPVSGGDILRGSWLTITPGPVAFELFMGDVPYGERQLVQ